MTTETMNGNGKPLTDHDVERLPIGEDFKKRLHTILQEAAMDFYGVLGSGFDPYDMFQRLTGWDSYPYLTPAWYRQSQKRGENIPIYMDEHHLRFIRDRSRKLCAENPFCQCAIDNMKNYVVGEDGYILTAVSVSKKNPAPSQLLTRVQAVLDLWQEHNDIPEAEADIVERGIIDGEAFKRHFCQASGLVIVRDIEAEHIISPPGGAYGPHYSFGVQTDPEDIQTIEGYWAVENPISNPMPSFVPASEVTHFKFNTKQSAKRGMPTFFSTEVMLRDAVELLRGTVVTANVRARYAVVRKFASGIIKDAASKMLTELNTATVNDPSSGQQHNVERVPFGSVKNIGAGQEIEFPGANLESDAFYKALQMVLRAIAARLNMPEWMLSADASNANYASSLVAEAPSTKMFARMQKFIGRRIGENRAKSRRSMAWTQVVWAVRCGVLPAETLRLVKIQTEPPSLVVRDQVGEANTNAVYLQARIKSRTTIRMEQNLDNDQENANFAKEDKEDAQRALQQRATEINAQATMPNKVGQATHGPESDAEQHIPNEGEKPAAAGRVPLTEADSDSLEQHLPDPVSWKKTLQKLWKDNIKDMPGKEEEFEDMRSCGLCTVASEHLQKHLKSKGIDTKKVSGDYHVPTEPRYGPQEHDWLQTKDGTIIDPTESQYHDDVKLGHITVHPPGELRHDHYKPHPQLTQEGELQEAEGDEWSPGHFHDPKKGIEHFIHPAGYELIRSPGNGSKAYKAGHFMLNKLATDDMMGKSIKMGPLDEMKAHAQELIDNSSSEDDEDRGPPRPPKPKIPPPDVTPSSLRPKGRVRDREVDYSMTEGEDQIPGGKADKKQPSDFPREALKAGIKIEMEHTDDPLIAMEIAMDHLIEDLDYYTKLKKMEAKPKKVKEGEGVGQQEHKFSTTHINLPADAADEVLQLSSIIPDELIDQDEGREDKPHITVKYGIHTDDASEVENLLHKYGPVAYRFGQVAYFAGEDGKPDVVYIEVESDEIEKLNAWVCKSLKCTDTQPNYVPHVTVAYVTSGNGAEVAETLNSYWEPAKGITDATEIIFSNREKQTTSISLL